MVLFSIAAAAEALGISRPTAYRLVETGELPTIKIGKRRKVKQEVIDNILQNGTK